MKQRLAAWAYSKHEESSWKLGLFLTNMAGDLGAPPNNEAI